MTMPCISVVVCATKEAGASIAPVPGSTDGACDLCKGSIWLAPGCRELNARTLLPPFVICYPCSAKGARKEAS